MIQGERHSNTDQGVNRMALKKTATPVRRSIASFKASHDPAVILPAKLRKALDAMAKEGPPTMQQRSGLSAVQISQHRAAFAPHIVRVDASGTRRGKYVWFATPK